MLGTSLSIASLGKAAEMLVHASCSRVMTRDNPEAQPVISSTRFAAISEIVCEPTQRSTNPKTPYERTKRAIEEAIARHSNFGDWLDENNFDVAFVDAYAFERRVGTCVVLKAREQVEVSPS